VALKVVIYLASTVAYIWQPTHLVLQASELHTACSVASHREMSGNANSAEVRIFSEDICLYFTYLITP
jgi:hypothetical protein